MKNLREIGLILIVNCLIAVFCGNAQNSITDYQYWFDNDYASSLVEAVSPTELLQLNTDVSIETVPGGLHTFTIRFKDNNGVWSVPVSRYFYHFHIKNNLINSYQYWFDHDYTTNTIVQVTPSQNVQVNDLLSIEAMDEGLHLITLQFKDNYGKWSVPISQFFYKSKASGVTDNKIIAYRYWIDEDIENAKYIEISNPSQLLNLNEDLNLSDLPGGDYTIHFQFKDASGKWSLVTSDSFTLIVTSIVESSFDKTILVYPNPSIDFVHLDLKSTFNVIQIQLYDNSGRKITQQVHKKEQTLKIALNNYSSGIYYLKVLADDKRATFKVIKN